MDSRILLFAVLVILALGGIGGFLAVQQYQAASELEAARGAQEVDEVGGEFAWRERELDLSGLALSGEDLARLGGFDALVRLNLQGSSVSDEQLAILGGLSHLESLDLTGTKITDVGLAHLQGLRSLASLQLQFTAVSDAGLTLLEDFPDLRFLDLRGTQVTAEGGDRFRQSHSKCRVLH